MEIQPHLPEVHTAFIRRRCRNPKCGAKLKRETDNPRNAFCCRDCFERHYKKICLVCERPLRSRTGRPQQFCSPKCKVKFHRHSARFLGKWGSPPVTLPGALRKGVGSARKSGLKIGTKRGRPPRILAGPSADLDPINLAIDTETFAHVRRLNHRHWTEAALIGPRDMPLNLKHARDLEREIERRRAASEADHG